MQARTLVRLVAPTGLALGAAAQAPVVVPIDFADVQAAIDGVAAGGTVVVQGGEHDPIVIDKPLTLVGDPAPLFRPIPGGGPFTTHPPLIALQGPGAGRVVLKSVDTGGSADGQLYATFSAPVAGGGFDALVVEDCSILAPTWINLSGGAFGAAAVDVSVPTVLIERSTLRGGRDRLDICASFSFDGHAGVRAPGASLVVLDSLVEGGAGEDLCLAEVACNPALATGGAGGPGVVVDRLFHAQSTIRGGAGGAQTCWGVPISPAPSGPDVVAGQVVHLTENLFGDDPLAIGQSWDLGYVVAGAVSVLFVAYEPGVPFEVPPLGWLFFAPSSVIATPFVPGGVVFGIVTKTFHVPADASLVGLPLIFQIWDTDQGMTRPLVKTIEP